MQVQGGGEEEGRDSGYVNKKQALFQAGNPEHKPNPKPTDTTKNTLTRKTTND